MAKPPTSPNTANSSTARADGRICTAPPVVAAAPCSHEVRHDQATDGGACRHMSPGATGGRPERSVKRLTGKAHNIKVLSLVERDGDIRSVVIDRRKMAGMIVTR